LPANDLTLITAAAREAGAVAMRYWQKQPKVWEKPGQGPVTEADIAVNDLLLQRLQGARPKYGILSEETPDNSARLDFEHVFIIDPIDGTRAFISGEKHFAISIAVARAGVIEAGAIFLPALDRLYTAQRGGPALCNGAPISATSQANLDGAKILMSKGYLQPEHWRSPPGGLQRGFRSSIAYRLCLVADGSFDAMIATRDTWEWDIAAGSLIASAAGARVTNRFGGALVFNSAMAKTTGILAAAAPLHPVILSQFKA
jgi:myo-inositol-1(or 4)-monophosphatase